MVGVQVLARLIHPVGEAMMTTGYWIHYWVAVVHLVQTLGVAGVHHIPVGAYHNPRLHLLPRRPIDLLHLKGEVLPCLGVVGACSNFHQTPRVVAWYLGVEGVELLDPNCSHSHLVVVGVLPWVLLVPSEV